MAESFIFEAKERGHTNLYMNYLHLSEIPESLLSLHGVKNLYLKYNIITKLPKKIYLLRKLEELYLHSNNLQELPEEIGGLQRLLSLNVSNNYLKSLTPKISQLSMLQKLHLANNALVELPTALGLLKNLRVLDVTNNKLKQLPWELSKCTSLEILAFDGNEVWEIPLSFTRLRMLQELSASRNKICSLPQDLDQLTSLTDLYVDTNLNLGVIPATVLKMTSVKIFGFNRCGETFCPPSCHVPTSSVISLRELSLRTVWKHTSGRTVEFLPSNLRGLLFLPRGHCFWCGQAYFSEVFTDVEDAMRTINVIQPSNMNAKTFDNAQISFAFLCCSLICRRQVKRLFDEEELE